jgi:hypothetical protein
MRTQADEAHPDQNLSALAELGVPLSRALMVGGQTIHVRDILTDLIANFSLRKTEVEWMAISLSLYLPPQREWADKFGDRTSFDDLALALTSMELERQSCAGTHVFQAMVLLCLADQAAPVLTEGPREELLVRIAHLVESMESTQGLDGTWGLHWFSEPGSSSGNDRKVDDNLLLVTGHLAEFSLYLPADMRPTDEVLRRAGEWLWSRLRETKNADAKFLSRFCPWTHAACAVRQMRQ